MKTSSRLTFVCMIFVVLLQACNLPIAASEKPSPTPTVGLPTITPTVTVEPTETAVPTDTAIPPTETPSLPPELTLSKNSNCRVGPSSFYNIVDQISAGKTLKVTGRNDENTWWQVINATGRECWVYNENATPNSDFSTLLVASAPPLPGIPLNFAVVNLDCQPVTKKYSVTFSWSSGGGETVFRLFRDGKQIIELKAGKTNFKDTKAPIGKNLTYELEGVNANGTSERAVQFVVACK